MTPFHWEDTDDTMTQEDTHRAEETLDPTDWETTRALAHRMMTA